MNDIHQEKVEAGQVEKVKASEEVIRRNVQAVIEHSNMTRKMLIELKVIVDSLQNKMIAFQNDLIQQRHQLANVQQILVARGTHKTDGD